MYSRFQLGLKYLHYYFSASNSRGHGMHSPFVFDFITQVLNDHTVYPAYTLVENLRADLSGDTRKLVIEDFGAGSSLNKSNERPIGSIAKHAAKPARFGQLLYRIVKHYQPQIILELGTSLGITTSYLAAAAPGSRIITMEGAPSIAAVARQGFNKAGLKNIEIIEGNFDDTLGGVVSGMTSLDLAFIDGNHRRDPTLRYFHQLLPLTHNDSMLIFDDIHWSSGMEQAWTQVQQHSAVRCTIDLFFIGIVLFRHEFKARQHFTIRF